MTLKNLALMRAVGGRNGLLIALLALHPIRVFEGKGFTMERLDFAFTGVSLTEFESESA
jgi:hypothetical protein